MIPLVPIEDVIGIRLRVGLACESDKEKIISSCVYLSEKRRRLKSQNVNAFDKNKGI